MITSTVTQPSANQSFAPAAMSQSTQGWLGKLNRALGRWFAASSEPRITQFTDQQGQTWWRAYNPRTRQLQWLTSETEVLLWLDAQAND